MNYLGDPSSLYQWIIVEVYKSMTDQFLVTPASKRVFLQNDQPKKANFFYKMKCQFVAWCSNIGTYFFHTSQGDLFLICYFLIWLNVISLSDLTVNLQWVTGKSKQVNWMWKKDVWINKFADSFFWRLVKNKMQKLSCGIISLV